MGDPTGIRSDRCSTVVVLLLATALIVALSAAAAPTAQAEAFWTAPQPVFSTPVNAIPEDSFSKRKALDVAGDAAGNSIAVWIQQPSPAATECQAMEATRPAGGSFGVPQPLAPVMSFCAAQIKLAMNASGTAVVAWRQGPVIDAAIEQPGGSFSAPVTLSASTTTDDPWVSINSSGMAAITWDDTAVGSCPGLTAGTNWAFHAVIFQPGLGFGGAETVCDAPHPGGSGPTVFTPRSAVDPQGDVVAAWVNGYNDGTNSHTAVEWAYRPAGGNFDGATPHILAESLNAVSPPASFAAGLAFDGQGRATAVWTRETAGQTVVETAARAPGAGSAFAPGVPISAGPENAHSPSLAVDPGTNTAVADWLQCSGTACQVEASARPSGGGFQAPQALSGAGPTSMYGPLVAFDPDGVATAIWSSPSPDTTGTQVQAARLPGIGQAFGAVSTISNDDPSLSPALAFDGEGNAIAVWEHDTSAPAGAILEYAGLDAGLPHLQSVSIPGSGSVGQALSFAATAFDRWSLTALSWEFGDGTGASGNTVTHLYAKPGSYAVTVTARDAAGRAVSAKGSLTISAPATPGSTPRVSFHLRFHAKEVGQGRTRFESIFVTGLTRGAKVLMRCSAMDKGCPFKAKKVKKTGPKANLAELLGGHALDAGALIQVQATKKGFTGRVGDLKVAHGGAKLRFLCLPPGKGKARPCGS